MPIIGNGNVEAYELSHFKMGKIKRQLGNYAGRNEIHPCIQIKMQRSASYPVLSLKELTFLSSSYINILKKSIVFLVQLDVFIHPAAKRSEF